MIDKLKSLKEKNKILYYILIPLLGIGLLVAGISKILSDLNVLSAKKDLKKVELKDIDLKIEQKEAELKAQAMQDEAKQHGDKAEQHEAKANEKTNGDEDWHLQRNNK